MDVSANPESPIASQDEEDVDEESLSSDDYESETDDGQSDGSAGICDNYMKDIYKLLQDNSEVNFANCLELNKHMQKKLELIQEHLDNLLQSLYKRYKDNEAVLTNNLTRKSHSANNKGAYLRGGTFYFKGNMYFRDSRGRCCPNNPDYLKRSSEGEMFPMDFNLRSRHIWSVADKVSVVQAIKQQILAHLRDKNKREPVNPNLVKLRDNISMHTDTIVQLLAKVDDKFEIDWSEISAHNLQLRHTPSSCKAMWNVYLQPALRRGEWTDEENQRLVNAVEECRHQDWQRVAELVGQRSDYQCFVQFKTAAFQLLPQQPIKWDAEEDRKLMKIVEESKENGMVKWHRVMTHYPNTPKSSIMQRYTYSLNPYISHAQFTPEEDLILLAAIEQYGAKFSSFPRTLFPNRTTVQLRSRYRNILESRHKQTPWFVEDDRKLIEFVTEHGTSDWTLCAQVLGNHTRTSCRTRFLTIKKFLEQNPNMSVEDIPRRKVRKVSSTISTENWLDKIKELREDPTTDLKQRRERRRKGPAKPAQPSTIVNATAEDSGGEQESDSNSCKSSKTMPYRSTLRNVGKDYYDMFKYAYKLYIGKDVAVLPPNDRFRTAMDVLRYQSNQKDPPLQFIPANVRESYKAFLQRSCDTAGSSNPIEMPPNYSLMLGLRALTINKMQMHESKGIEMAKPSQHDAVLLFRQRFKSLFRKTLLMSQVEHHLPEGKVPRSEDVQLLIAEKQHKCSTRKRTRSSESQDATNATKAMKLSSTICLTGDECKHT